MSVSHSAALSMHVLSPHSAPGTFWVGKQLPSQQVRPEFKEPVVQTWAEAPWGACVLTPVLLQGKGFGLWAMAGTKGGGAFPHLK